MQKSAGHLFVPCHEAIGIAKVDGDSPESV